MKKLISFHTQLAAVRHLVAPLATETQVTIILLLAIVALTINARQSGWLVDHKHSIRVANVYCKFVLFINYMLNEAMTNIFKTN